MGPTAGEKMRKDVEGGWPYLLELYSKHAAHDQEQKS